MYKKFIVLGVLVSLVFLGCGMFSNNDTSEGSVSISFEMDPTVAARALTNLPSWSTAEVRISGISFDYTVGTEIIMFDETVSSVVNLLTGESDPALPGFNLEPGTYEGLSFGADLADDGVTPSILLEGDWNGTPIRVVFLSGETFEAEGDILVVEPDTQYEVKVVLDPDIWFNSITDEMLTNATVGEDGFIELSDSSNATIFDEYFAEALDVATEGVLPGSTAD